MDDKALNAFAREMRAIKRAQEDLQERMEDLKARIQEAVDAEQEKPKPTKKREGIFDDL